MNLPHNKITDEQADHPAEHNRQEQEGRAEGRRQEEVQVLEGRAGQERSRGAEKGQAEGESLPQGHKQERERKKINA